VNEYSLEVKRFVEEKNFSIPVSFVVKTTPSSMHSLFALAPYLAGDQFLLSTVDSIFNEQELVRFLDYGKSNPTLDGLLAVTNFIDDENPLYVACDASSRVLGFSKTEHSPWVTGGLYLFSPRIFQEMDVVLGRRIERLRNFLGHLVNSGYAFEAFPFSKIIDVDHVHDIHTAEELLRGH
jgi:NDP-sugar pyrophosphorylase family protein